MMDVIEIETVSKSFGSFRAVSDVSMIVQPSEFVTFLGPSGCGKTTTLRILAGFLIPDTGKVSVGGRILSGPGHAVPPERRRMGMVFQNYAIWPHMSLFDNVAFGLKLQRLTRREIGERVDRILDVMGLSGLEDRSPGQLSGGQQQRVALARSLVVEPSILLLDEPLSNLDAKLRERMRIELKALQRQTGITFVYVTHDQAEALAMSDRVVVFREGRVQQIGSPVDVYRHPANLFVADFMGQANKLDGTVLDANGTHHRVRIGPHVITAAGNGLAPGSPVVVIVRPESVRLDPPGPDGPNRFDAVVTEAVFLGGTVEYVLDIAGATIRAQTLPDTLRQTGSNVRVELSPDDCVAMSAEAN
jgi:iron(III) transport system ATP-binding protein